MKKEVLAEGIELYLGDCREILPMLGKFDAVVTDPPYGQGYAANPAKVPTTGQWESKHGTSDWDDDRPDNSVFEAILASSDSQIIWGGNYFTDFLPPTPHWLIWDKGQRGFSLADCEIAWSSQNRAARVFNYSRALARDECRKVHPTQKSIAVMEWCIGQLPENASSILDPFMGSGTTGVAAVKLGCKFTGIEIEHKYFDMACKRIADVLARPDLFIEPPAKAKQEAFEL